MRRSAAALALALLLPLPGLAGQVVVKQGETLSDIAARYGVSVDRLLQLNGIKDPKGLQIGTKLTVPGAPSSPSRGGSSQGGSSQGISSQGISSQGSGGRGNYTVKSGETISEIADRYNISSERLLELNGIRDPKGLQVGRRITVPTAGPAKPAKPPVLPAITSAQGKALSHTVRPGDTLSDIANTYGVPVEKIAALNGLKDPDNLVPDTQLKLRNPPPVPKPAKRPPAKAASTPAPKPAAAPVAAAPKPAAAKPGATPASGTATAGTTPSTAPLATTKPAETKPAETKPNPVATKPAAETPGATKPAATKPVVTTPAVSKPEVTKPVVSQPVVTKPVVAKPVVEKPAVSTAQAVKPEPSPQAEKAQKPEVKPEPKPVVKAEVTPKAETTKPAKTEVGTGVATSKPAKPDWRSFGPLQVDWANWQPMGGSFVAPGLNATGQSFYLAVNCSAKRINATGPSGAWKTWDLPSTDYEQQLVKDLCRDKGA